MSEASDQMISLLQELSILKELDLGSEANDAQSTDQQSRRNRIAKIKEEMHNIAERKKAESN